MGLIGGHIRLPLTPLSESCQPRVLEACARPASKFDEVRV
jgi:hypothetical protein